MTTLTQLLKALSDPSRLRIMHLLMDVQELCVCDIEAVLNCTQTKVSRHLAYLRKAGLVTDRRSGLWIIYSLAPPSSDDHRKVLEMLKDILPIQSTAKKDRETLRKRFADGCCAVSSIVYPEDTKDNSKPGRHNGKQRYQAVGERALRKDCC
jgi:ArsR family transcriptional regulator